jgi:hypothetical protein
MDMVIAAVITAETPVPATRSPITATATIMGAMAADTAEAMAMAT